MAGSYFLARQLAPSAAKWLAEPIVRRVFEHKLKQSGVPDALVDSVQTALCTAVQSMAESIAYLVLIAAFSGRAQHTDIARGQGAPAAQLASPRSACSMHWPAARVATVRPVCCSSCSYCSVHTGSIR